MIRSGRSLRARLAATALCAGALAAGCAVVPKAEPGGEALSGRLSVRVDATPESAARNLSAAFELRGDGRQGQLDLSTPLGSVLAQARWAPGSVVLATPGSERTFADLGALTREALGETVPIEALFDWLRGRPWPGAPSVANPSAPGFSQLGWSVDLARFDEAWIAAQRAAKPAVQVRARLDRP
ncbi:MAG: lipoprotein insertase outer membrane protein LolB [Burkholderiaceae bacterium]